MVLTNLNNKTTILSSFNVSGFTNLNNITNINGSLYISGLNVLEALNSYSEIKFDTVLSKSNVMTQGTGTEFLAKIDSDSKLCV